MKYNFIKTTAFCLIGCFPISVYIPLLALFFQNYLKNKLGIECSKFWTIIPASAIILGLILPFLFYCYIKLFPPKKINTFNLKLIIFNFFEFLFMQFGLLYFFEPVFTFCNCSDPQGPAIIIVTGFVALPILIIISFLFGNYYNKNRT